MINGIERRRHLRVPLALPFEIVTPRGAIKGKTADISVSGLSFILSTEAPIIEDQFEITIKTADNHEMSITCEKVWSDNITVRDTGYNAMGVKFIKISPSDLKIIGKIVVGYYA